MPIKPPNLQLPGIVNTTWCLDVGLGSQSTLSSPPLAAWSPLERGLCQVCGCIHSFHTRSRIGGKKRLGRWCVRSWQMFPLTKWWTNMKGHESSTKTNFFSSCQRLAFPCVCAAIMCGTGVPVPPHARLPLWEVRERGIHKRKMVRWSPDNLPVKLPQDGKTGHCNFCCGHLLEHPLRMGEDLR